MTDRMVRRLQINGRWPLDVDVWHVAMPQADAHVNRDLLSDDERERAVRYRQPADRLRFVVTRVVLRELLAARLEVAPAALRFTARAQGRPELGDFPRLSFNVSHSGAAALIVISEARGVGVDVERIDPDLNWLELTELVCTAEERRALIAQPAYLQRDSFFRLWTAKEAVMKALGIGIADGLRAISINLAGNGIQRPLVSDEAPFGKAKAYQYHWLEDVPGCMGCVAYSDAR
jgi:4'-phosphopantetheinyl transferase